MNNFFEKFKERILRYKNDDKFKWYIRYYETMLQQKEELKPLVNDAEKYELDMRLDVSEKEQSEGYVFKEFDVYLFRKMTKKELEEAPYGGEYDDTVPLNYHYHIVLSFDERYWGYCECTPDMEDYNNRYKCCGHGCDWAAPQITVTKIVDVAYFSFDGDEHDMWELEDKWKDELKGYNNKRKQEEIHKIEENIKRLEEEKEKLLSEKP